MVKATAADAPANTGRLAPRALAATALAVYAAVSVLLFGLPLGLDFSHAFIARGDAIGRIDATQTMWFLAWWPYALGHRLNPFVTHLVWSPAGVDLAWTTSIPGVSIPAAPVTLALGPVAAYNILSLLAPPLAAWTTFLLCRHLTKAFWPSLIAGYVFGFSTYEFEHVSSGNLNLTLVFLVPLAVYLVLLYLDAMLATAVFLVLLTLVLVWQFMLSAEIFATLTVFGAFAWCLALGVMPREVRNDLLSAGKVIAAAYALAGLVLSPLVLGMLRDAPRQGLSLDAWSTDLANFVVPASITLFRAQTMAGVAQRFGREAYVGLPLLAIVGWYGWAQGRTAIGRLLLVFLAVVGLAALGPVLHLAGRALTPLPWALAARFPLVNKALPVRFVMYVSLTVAIIVALWLQARETPAWAKWVLVPLGIASLLPVSVSSPWVSRLDTPRFFADGLYRSYLTAGENVLVIPYGGGASMLWQAQSGFYFRMAGGCVNVWMPPEFSRWPVVYTLYFGTLMPGHPAQLRAFLAAHRITSIVVAPPSTLTSPTIMPPAVNETQIARGVPMPAAWPRELFSTLGTPPIEVGGVTLYRVPLAILGGDGGPTRLEMDRRASLAQWSALVSAAQAYLSHGFALPTLTPLKAEKQALLPGYWGGFGSGPGSADPGQRFWTINGLWLGPGPNHTVGIGMLGSYAALQPVFERYGGAARAVYFPAPQPWRGQPTGKGLLLMLFTPDDVARLAAGDN